MEAPYDGLYDLYLMSKVDFYNREADNYNNSALAYNACLLYTSNKTTSATTGNNLSGEMKTFYSDYLIDMAEPLLVHDQFGQKHPIPKNGGKTIEFRKYDPLPKATTALTEGVTPEGQKLNMGAVSYTHLVASFRRVCPKCPRLEAFIGFTKPGGKTPVIKTSPRWCPLREGNGGHVRESFKGVSD